MSEDVAATLALLGGREGEPVVDLLADPGAGCRALDGLGEMEGLVLRVAPELGAPSTTHSPAPARPFWLRVMRGAREVGLARAGEGMVRRAERVDLDERDEACCDTAGCALRRVVTEVWVVLEPIEDKGAPHRLLATEQRVTAGTTPSVAHAVAARIASVLDVPLQRAGADVSVAKGEGPAPLEDAPAVAELGRFALRGEGERVVIRDWQSLGPRSSAARNGWIGGALLALAIGAWALLARAVSEGTHGEAVAAGIAGALLTLAGYAFVGVARFSARYGAPCAAVVAVGRDQLIALPWVARDGGVDLRPEGRLGAAIGLGEVRGASAASRGEGFAVEIDTDHGRIDLLACSSAATARFWSKVIDRVVDEARHPRQGASAKQRAKERASSATATE
jgi:hypothetical protein